MGIQKVNCLNCDKEFEADVQICCTSASADCGCLGQPTNGPIVCSEKCYDEYIEKIMEACNNSKNKSFRINP